MCKHPIQNYPVQNKRDLLATLTKMMFLQPKLIWVQSRNLEKLQGGRRQKNLSVQSEWGNPFSQLENKLLWGQKKKYIMQIEIEEAGS